MGTSVTRNASSTVETTFRCPADHSRRGDDAAHSISDWILTIRRHRTVIDEPMSTHVAPFHRDAQLRRGDVDIATIGSMLADPGRCRMLLALGDGRSLAAHVLAIEAGVTPATASGHLGKMVAAGLLTVTPQGRNRHFRIADPLVGRTIELRSQLAPATPVRSLRQGIRADALREARTCYDHIAGRLGVDLMASMLRTGHLRDESVCDRSTPDVGRAGYRHEVDYRLTAQGVRFLVDVGVVVPRAPVVRHCLDWSERRHHLSGAPGRGLLDRLIALGWVQRTPHSRAITVTPAGREGIFNTFDVVTPRVAAP
jgi:DNA-binding transcriptional ArsR family regulator